MKKAFVVSLALALMTGCSSKKTLDQPPQAVQAQVIEPQQSDGRDGSHYSAVVTPDSQVPLGFRIAGYVVALKQVRGQDGRMRDIAEGDSISKGAVLVQIRPAEYEDKVHQASSQIDAAEATFQKAKLDYDRATRLYAAQSLTKPDLDSAQAQYDATQAQLRAARALTSEAQIALRDTALVAPFSGEVVKKNVELGAFVGPGYPLLAIANTDLVKLVIGVPDVTVRSLRLGKRVEVSIDAFPGRTFEARISRIASAADTTTRNFEVEVAIPNREHQLKAGMIGSLQLLPDTKATQRERSLLVPLSSIVQNSDGKYGVFVIMPSGRVDVARMRAVQVGSVDGPDITIVAGLDAGEKIVTDGANLLKDGQPVEVLK
jgi:RND family efflux transporter MFP subunit